MNTEKLNEALIELRHQRSLIDIAIKNLEGILETLNGASRTASSRRGDRKSESYIDLGVRILEEAGQPMHIVEIAKRISGKRGRPIPRASVESSFIRHIATKGKNARIVKTKPAHFGLPIFSLFAKNPQDSAA